MPYLVTFKVGSRVGNISPITFCIVLRKQSTDRWFSVAKGDGRTKATVTGGKRRLKKMTSRTGKLHASMASFEHSTDYK